MQRKTESAFFCLLICMSLVTAPNALATTLANDKEEEKHPKGLIDYFGLEGGHTSGSDDDFFARVTFSASYLRGKNNHDWSSRTTRNGVTEILSEKYDSDEWYIRMKVTHSVSGPDFADVVFKLAKTSTRYKDGHVITDGYTALPFRYRDDEELGYTFRNIGISEKQYGIVYPFESADQTIFFQIALDFIGFTSLERHSDGARLSGLSHSIRMGMGRQTGKFRIYLGLDAAYLHQNGFTEEELETLEVLPDDAWVAGAKLDVSYELNESTVAYIALSKDVIDFDTVDGTADSRDSVERALVGIKYYPGKTKFQNVWVRHFRDSL